MPRKNKRAPRATRGGSTRDLSQGQTEALRRLCSGGCPRLEGRVVPAQVRLGSRKDPQSSRVGSVPA